MPFRLVLEMTTLNNFEPTIRVFFGIFATSIKTGNSSHNGDSMHRLRQKCSTSILVSDDVSFVDIFAREHSWQWL